jgi:hypothetical protein
MSEYGIPADLDNLKDQTETTGLIHCPRLNESFVAAMLRKKVTLFGVIINYVLNIHIHIHSFYKGL